MLDFANPHIWWCLTRASAIVAWVLLTMTVVWGILLKTRILRGADNPEWLKITHRYISGLALTMIAVHVGTLLLDEFIQFGPADVFIPFATSFKPLPVALGVFALYLLLAIQMTALAAKWLPDSLWKGIHLSSYAVVGLVALHSGLVGTDVGMPWYTAMSVILITTATLAAIIRMIVAGRAKPPPPASPAQRSHLHRLLRALPLRVSLLLVLSTATFTARISPSLSSPLLIPPRTWSGKPAHTSPSIYPMEPRGNIPWRETPPSKPLLFWAFSTPTVKGPQARGFTRT